MADIRTLICVVSPYYILFTQHILKITISCFTKNQMVNRTTFMSGPNSYTKFEPKDNMTAQQLAKLLPLLLQEWIVLRTSSMGYVSTTKVDALEPSLKQHFEGSQSN